MITRSEIQAAIKVMKGRSETSSSAVNEFKEPIDPMEVAHRWVVESCRLFMEDIPVSRIAHQFDCDEGLVERALEEHLGDYLEAHSE